MPFFVFTGMSEKLQSIPKETIQGAPKEVVLPPAPDQNGFTNFENIPPNEFTNFENIPPNEFPNFENIPPGLNSTELRGEELPPDGKSDHDENDEIPNTQNSEIHIPNPLNNKIHIPATNTISRIEPTNLDEPKTAFDTANSIDVELNSTVEPNNFDERGSNSIKNEQNNIDDETLKVSSEQPEFESNSEPELEANISDNDEERRRHSWPITRDNRPRKSLIPRNLRKITKQNPQNQQFVLNIELIQFSTQTATSANQN